MNDARSTRPTPNRKRWQFSVRGMLLFTAVVAAVLSVAVQLPGLFQVVLIAVSIGCFVAALMWTANVATSDKRPLLAAFSWILFGTFFSAYAALGCLALIREISAGFYPGVAFPSICYLMAICGLVCFYRAVRALVRWCQPRDAASDKTEPQ